MYKGKLVRFRTFELSDLDDILTAFNNYEMRRFLDLPLPFSTTQEEEWIRNSWIQREQGTGYHFVIEEKNTSKVIGSVGLDQITP